MSVAWLFGSRAQGRERAGSDHDVAVLFDTPRDWLAVEEVAEALRGPLGTPVDVVDLERAPLELRAAAVREGRVLYSADEARRVAFQSRTWSEWLDYRPALQQLTRSYLRHVAQHGLG